tara:strand:+ start:5979 stop:6500 length:522 start_codon:yes stop_codon:yes gene_type:complete
MTNLVAKTLTALPEEVCNIIYEYYKLPFLEMIQLHRATSIFANTEEEYGVEITEMLVDILVRNKLRWQNPYSNNLYYNLFGFYNLDGLNKNRFHYLIDDDKLTRKQKITVARNIEVYNSNHMFIPTNRELNRVRCHYEREEVTDTIKKICKDNKIRVQHNSRVKTLYKKLMKL